MIDEKTIIKAGKLALKQSILIIKEKQKIAQEVYKLIKIAAIKQEQEIDENRITRKIYDEVKKIGNEKIKKILIMPKDKKWENENIIIKEIITNSLD